MSDTEHRGAWSRLLPRGPHGKWAVHPLTLFVLATVATLGGGIWLWQTNQHELLEPSAFQLTWDKIQTTPQPSYVGSDLKKLAFDGSHLSELNLLDHELVKKVHAAFAVQSWVEHVSVDKNRDGVFVSMSYRRPVALVEFGDNLLLPVDRAGIVLDGQDLNPDDVSQFVRINVASPQVGSLVNGEVWPDPRIVAAAMIADRVASQANRWGIVRIAHVPIVPNSTAAEGDFEFLTARGQAGIRVMWGSPPRFERPNEASAEKKLDVLATWIAERGTLEELGTSQTIDLRSGKIQVD